MPGESGCLIKHARASWTSLALDCRLDGSLTEPGEDRSLHIDDRHGPPAALLHHLIPFAPVLAHVIFNQVHA